VRDLLRPTAVAAALLTPFLIVGACSVGDSSPKPVPEPDEKPAVAGFTHDGALPIAVITSFEDARREVLNTKADVAAARACSFMTPEAQERVMEDARDSDLVGGDADCGAAMRALVEEENVPERVATFEVVRAEDAVSEVLVVRKDGTAHMFTLTGDRKDGLWSVDAIEDAEAPEPEPTQEPLPDAPVDGSDGDAAGEDEPAPPSVTVLPGEEKN
jgi:hypothetical protein